MRLPIPPSHKLRPEESNFIPVIEPTRFQRVLAPSKFRRIMATRSGPAPQPIDPTAFEAEPARLSGLRALIFYL